MAMRGLVLAALAALGLAAACGRSRRPLRRALAERPNAAGHGFGVVTKKAGRSHGGRKSRLSAEDQDLWERTAETLEPLRKSKQRVHAGIDQASETALPARTPKLDPSVVARKNPVFAAPRSAPAYAALGGDRGRYRSRGPVAAAASSRARRLHHPGKRRATGARNERDRAYRGGVWR